MASAVAETARVVPRNGSLENNALKMAAATKATEPTAVQTTERKKLMNAYMVSLSFSLVGLRLVARSVGSALQSSLYYDSGLLPGLQKIMKFLNKQSAGGIVRMSVL